MTGSSRRWLRLSLGWAYLGVVLPTCVYLVMFQPKLWDRWGIFIVLVISIETGASTHFAGAASDTPTEEP